MNSRRPSSPAHLTAIPVQVVFCLDRIRRRRPVLSDRIPSLATVFLAASGLCLSAQDVPVDTRPTVSVTSGKPSLQPSYYSGHKGHQYERHTITMRSADIAYALHYRACVDETHGDRVGIVEGTLGLPSPSRENWYGGGFLKLELNGEDISSWRLVDRRVTDRGERGGCQYIWETPMATIRFRFLLLPDKRYLCSELAWHPKETIESARVHLLCFPSFFTSARNRKGDRHVVSAVKDVPQGKPFPVDPARESYLFYKDAIFDPARGEGVGPCAVWFDPACIRSGRVNIGSYGVSTVLDIAPDRNRVHLAFWEFPDTANAEAWQQLSTDAAEIPKLMQSLQFTPLALGQGTLSRRSQDMAQLLATIDRPDASLKTRADDALRLLDRWTASDGSPEDWALEAKILETLPDLERALWELRIQRLLQEGDRIRQSDHHQP